MGALYPKILAEGDGDSHGAGRLVIILGLAVIVGPLLPGWLLGGWIEKPGRVRYLVLFVPVATQTGGVGRPQVVFGVRGPHGRSFTVAWASERRLVKPRGERVSLFFPLVPHYGGLEAGHLAAVIVVVCVVWSRDRFPV